MVRSARSHLHHLVVFHDRHDWHTTDCAKLPQCDRQRLRSRRATRQNCPCVLYVLLATPAALSAVSSAAGGRLGDAPGRRREVAAARRAR